jgi:hypothetical protein
MSNRRSRRGLRTLALAGATAMLAGAALADPIESSCPDPCTTPPKSALFVRQPHGQLIANGDIVPLEGTMRVGTRHTVVRVDTGIVILTNFDPNLKGVYVTPRLNEYYSASYFAVHAFPCSGIANCSATGTFWFDIDALEAAHPGKFIGQPLTVRLEGGNTATASGGLDYEANFAAEVVKKK